MFSDATVSYAGVSYFDGTNYNPLVMTTVPAWQPGSYTIAVHLVPAPAMSTIDASTPSGPYNASAQAASYAGGTTVQLSSQGLAISLRYYVVIATR
jgi:hypothetical protein